MRERERRGILHFEPAASGHCVLRLCCCKLLWLWGLVPGYLEWASGHCGSVLKGISAGKAQLKSGVGISVSSVHGALTA